MKECLKADWKYEVENGDTVLGYEEWLQHKRESDECSEIKHVTAREYIAKARELHVIEGEIEVDDMSPDASENVLEDRISRSEDQSGEIGAYVKAWVRVNIEEFEDARPAHCMKCGKQIKPGDEVEDGIDGKMYVYCSQDCKDRH